MFSSFLTLFNFFPAGYSHCYRRILQTEINPSSRHLREWQSGCGHEEKGKTVGLESTGSLWPHRTLGNAWRHDTGVQWVEAGDIAKQPTVHHNEPPGPRVSSANIENAGLTAEASPSRPCRPCGCMQTLWVHPDTRSRVTEAPPWLQQRHP